MAMYVTSALVFACLAGHAMALCPVEQKKGSVCPQIKQIEVKFKPYYTKYFDSTGSEQSLYPRLLRNASMQCCKSLKKRLKFTPIENTVKDIEELVTDENCHLQQKTDAHLTFFFPVYIKGGEKVAFDEEFVFVQLTKSPGPAISMLKSEKKKMKVTASVAVLKSWSLFVLIMCLALTVGLLGWLLDHSSNPTHFSQWFYKGAWDGFWWAMVTITTVGYGDKVPVSFFARLLSILWMFCGAIILSLFTANVTSVLTSNQMDNSQNLIGSNIAVLNSKHYFESNLNVGGVIKEYNSQKEMFASLHAGKVDRILTPTANYPSFLDNDQVNDLAIVDVIPEPFLTGLVLANNNLSIADKGFLMCLKRKVKTMKYEIPSILDYVPSHESEGTIRTTMLFDQDILKIIYYNLIAIGVIAGIGIFLDIVKFLRIKHQQRGSNSEEIDMKSLREGNES